MMKHSQTNKILAAFGGQRAIARETGASLSTVHQWKLQGFIGHRWRDKVLLASVRLGLGLTAEAFLGPKTIQALGRPWVCPGCGEPNPAGAVACTECEESRPVKKAA